MCEKDGKTGDPPDESGAGSESGQVFEDHKGRGESDDETDPRANLNRFSDLENKLIGLFDRFADDGDGMQDQGSSEPGAPPRVIGDFKIIREIGEGGMGAVYEAEQISLKRKVALKILPSHLSFSDKAVLKFKREAEAGGRQSHPGIVAIHNVGEHEGVHFITQELVPGGTSLVDRLDEIRGTGKQPPGYFREVAELVLMVTGALQHAHDAGVIHRDIKPSNILLTEDGAPKVTDFGLAKVEDALSLSRTGDFSGTPYYMSPEQAMGSRMGIDKRTDIYSLGVTLYEMLTLSRPFEGETSQNVLHKIMLVDPVFPSRLNPRVPKDLSLICIKAMEKIPAKRYATMREFGDDLKRFLKGDVILAKPAGPGTRFWKRVKRNPVVSASVGVALVAVIVFAVVVPWIMYLNEQTLAQTEKDNAALLTIERDKALAAQKETDEQRELAERERDKALAAESEAEVRYRQVMRLSDVKRLANLEADAGALWPAYPENLKGFEDWLTRADEILGRLDLHRRTLSSLRETALPYGDREREEDRISHPQWDALQALKNSRSDFSAKIEAIESGEKGALKKRLAALDSRISSLEGVVSERRTWSFEDMETKWQHDMVAELVAGLEALSGEEEGLLESVRERLAIASTIEARSIDDHQAAWDEAIDSISNRDVCPRYNGLVINPKIGLVPLGRDPASGLWEFAHLHTGSIPERGPHGELVRDEGTGLVLVLIPGGAFRMGAVPPTEDDPPDSPNRDGEAQAEESPIHRVAVKPFFLSKYEMTQGQWLRFTGKNPSVYGPGTKFGGHPTNLLHPVENVSWYDCSRVLFRLKLRLPTEAEWEYAARAGTSTVFVTGNGKESLPGGANIADRCLDDQGGGTFQCDKSLDDGYVVHASTGVLSPNAFGLHDVHGNVFEWCEDTFAGSYENAPVDGTAVVRATAIRVIRGGSWGSLPINCRSSSRNASGANSRGDLVGLRPVASFP